MTGALSASEAHHSARADRLVYVCRANAGQHNRCWSQPAARFNLTSHIGARKQFQSRLLECRIYKMSQVESGRGMQMQLFSSVIDTGPARSTIVKIDRMILRNHQQQSSCNLALIFKHKIQGEMVSGGYTWETKQLLLRMGNSFGRLGAGPEVDGCKQTITMAARETDSCHQSIV